MKNYIIFIFLLILQTACSSTTDKGAIGVDRKQLTLVSSEEIRQASALQYQDVKKEAQTKDQLDKNPVLIQRLQAISKRIIPQTAIFRKDALGWDWEVHTITSDELNAYCMPGGKIIFYTGLIDKLKLTDAEVAAIMGHEISHALREHGRERMSEEILKNVGLEVLVATKTIDSRYAGLVNLAETVGYSLRNNRGQEKEADDMGMELMARAGFDPHEAITLWNKMSAVGGGKPPEILSTHPSDINRIKDMQSLLPKTLPLYQQARL